MPRIRLLGPSSVPTAFNRATVVLALAVVLFNVYRRFVLDAADPFKCGALPNTGQWLDSPDRKPDHKPFLNWQPPGCLLYEYKAPEIASCNEDGKILFVGDTLTRQLFWATARKIEAPGSKWVFKERNKPDTHSDLWYAVDGAKLKFIWDPWLNSSALHEELKAFRERQEPGFKEKDDPAKKELYNSRRSVVMLVGGGLWHARHYQEDFLRYFKQSVDSVISAAYGEGHVGPLEEAIASGREGVGDQIVFAPVIEPLYERLSPSREATIVPSKINAMNHYLQEKTVSSGVSVLWSYANMTRGRPETYGESGLHVIDTVASKMADVLLNLRCNAKAAQRQGYPYNRTCCSGYVATKWIQVAGLLCAVALFPFVLSQSGRSMSASPVHEQFEMSSMHQITNGHNVARPKDSGLARSTTSTPMSNVPFALFTLILSACCCFLADRTQVFNKFPKQFSNLDFRLILGLVLIACLFNIKAIPAPQERRRPSTPGASAAHSFLPRLQADEFKGWMQVYVLVYAYTGSSNVLDFYEVLRVFLAFYLFLSGYGHTIYFLQNKDYSLRRVATVLVRLNLLAVSLSFMMDRPYTSYHFAPLVSFWFMVVYLTLRARQHTNDSIPHIIGKIVTSALVVTLFIHIRGILELCFSVLHYTCRADLNATEWRFHLGMDKYIVYIGMIVAVLHVRIASILSAPAARLEEVPRIIQEYFNVLRRISVYAALVIVPLFWILTRRSHDKPDYNWWMPYIAWLPVVSFVVLRNATRFFRSYYCASFAWLGRISLELYLLSNHIWLAGDGRGLLRVGFRGDGGLFSDRWRDLVALTPIFVWAAWNVHAATMTVTAWIISSGDGVKGRAAAKSSHSRAGSELAFPNYDNALPGPASQGDIDHGLVNGRQGSGLSKDAKKKLLIIVGVVWLANMLYA